MKDRRVWPQDAGVEFLGPMYEGKRVNINGLVYWVGDIAYDEQGSMQVTFLVREAADESWQNSSG